MPAKEDHHRETARLLQNLGLLQDNSSLALPHNEASGVQRVSSIYFYQLPEGRQLVVKFDRQDRMAREKAVLKDLHREQCGVGCLLNYGGVLGLGHMQTAIVYQAAGATGFAKTLDQYLRETLRTPSEHCWTAVEMVFNVLEQLHQNTSQQAPSSNHISKWKDLFPKVAAKAEAIQTDASLQDLVLDDLLAFLEQETGTLTLGRIHGDLNLTNAIIATNKDLEPSLAYLIDFADSLPNQPTILDPVRLETELWQETAPALVSTNQEGEFLEGFKAIRNQLDTFSGEAQPPDDPLLRDLFELTQLIRQRAGLHTKLARHQYMTALGLTHLHATTFKTVRARPLKLKLALHGAALCQTALAQITSAPQPRLDASSTNPPSTSPFAQTVREQITTLLAHQQMTSCRVALRECFNSHFKDQPITSNAAHVAEALCERGLDNTITWLGSEVKALCEGPPVEAELSGFIWDTAEQILGWLVLLGVDEIWADQQNPQFLKMGSFHIPAITADGAGIAVQRVFKKPVNRLPPDTGPTRGWTLESGIEPTDRVRQVKQLIWAHYLPNETPPLFTTPDDDEELDYVFFSRGSDKEPGLVVDLNDGQHPVNCDHIKAELNKMKNFHVIYFNSAGRSCMVLPERRLVRAVHEFLRRRPGGKA